MSKQRGISSLELLLSLGIISSLSAYTLTLSEDVELSVKEYQVQTDIRELRKKIQSRKVIPTENTPRDSIETAEVESNEIEALEMQTAEVTDL